MPLALMLILLNFGYAIAVVQVAGEGKPVTWVLISGFLAVTAVFYAAVLSTHTQARLDCLLSGYLAAALIAALAGIAAYFHLFGSLSEPFVLYGRARGTFNDPNVLGAFLVLPAVLLFQRVLIGHASAVIRNGVLLMVLLAGLFLTFSRAAWGQFALSALVVMALCIVTAPSAGTRIRIVSIAIMGAVMGAIFLGALLAIPQVSDLFAQRATLDQSYDVGHFGRFGRYVLGAELGLERPFGIGPLQFSRFFGEDPHNSYLNAFMSGGWLSGFAYLTLTAVTLAAATRFLRAQTPWRSSYQVIYAASSGRGGRERHHRHRPLAPLFPDPGRNVGIDERINALSSALGLWATYRVTEGSFALGSEVWIINQAIAQVAEASFAQGISHIWIFNQAIADATEGSGIHGSVAPIDALQDFGRRIGLRIERIGGRGHLNRNGRHGRDDRLPQQPQVRHEFLLRSGQFDRGSTVETRRVSNNGAIEASL
jgi:hypothetical protein